MSDPIFGTDVVVPVIENQDNEIDADFEAFKSKFVKEDNVDADAVLKKAYHADRHISKIETENADLRQQVDRSLSYQDLLDKLQRQPASNQDSQVDGQRGSNQGGAATEKDIESLVERTFSKKQQEAIQASNMQYVAAELAKLWGSNFEAKLRQKGAELGLSEARLRDMVRNEPKVLLALATPAQAKVDDFTPPANRSRQTTSTANPARNKTYYDNLLKTDRKKWEASQNEMYDQAMKLGESFYK